MTLIITFLLLYNFHYHWSWYILAIGLWLIRLALVTASND